MATRKSTEAADSAETTVEKPANVVKKEPKYAVGKLREKSILLFGVSQSTFDGAMYGHTEEEYTKKRLKPSSMNGFTERKVKNNGRWNI